MLLNNKIIDELKGEFDNFTDSIGVIQLNLSEKNDYLTLAAGISIEPIIYFGKPKQIVEYLAFGAWQILSNDEVNDCLTVNSDLRCFGINSFQEKSETVDSEYWVLPKLWFEQHESTSSLNVVIDCRNQTKELVWHQIIDVINQINQSNIEINRQFYQSVGHNPPKDEWCKSIESAKSLINDKNLDKVVLARQTKFEFIDKVNPFLLLKKVQDEDNGVYNFCIKKTNALAFIGGTPERLFEIKNGEIESDAIAGTIFKPENSDVDQLKNKLLNSDKNIGEHQHVVDFIKSQMESLCDEWVVDNDRSLIELKYLLHLIMHFKGKMKKNRHWLSAINNLHPTPAVAGVPTKKALSVIKKTESFDRGWYAGPMGTISKNDAHIVVAIRSGEVIDNHVTLYAGAGIVAHSNPDEEWKELDAKINLFSMIFNKVNQ